MALDPTSASSLVEGMSGVFESGYLSDLVIHCGTCVWNVHRVVLCAQSEWFTKACNGDFKEAKERCIQLKEEDPEAVDALLRFLYKCDYTDDGKEVSAVVFNVRVFALTEKYFVRGLLTLAASKLRAAADKLWEEDAFADAISEIYSSTTDVDHHLRNELFEVVLKHAAALFNATGKYEHFRQIAGRTACFAMEAAQRFTDCGIVEKDVNLYACPTYNCKVVFRASFEKGGILGRRCHMCLIITKLDHSGWQAHRVEERQVLRSA